MNRYIVLGVLLFFTACGKGKHDLKVVNWQYPSYLKRDTNLIGVWYEYKEYKTNSGNIERYLTKCVYNSDGSKESYSFDTVAKNFNTQDLCAIVGSGERFMYWSTDSNILISYNLVRSRSEPDDPRINTYKYFFSQTKDTFYRGYINESDEVIRNNINCQFVRKMRPQ